MLNFEKSAIGSSINHDASQGLQHVVIVKNPGRHLAFPDLCQTRSGELLVVYRDGAEHVDHSGKIMLVRGCFSPYGLEFETPQCVCDTDLDDRDPSIVELANGTLLVNFFRLNRETGQLFLSVSQSVDKGENWCVPRDISAPGFSEGLATSDAVVELPSGDLVMAVYGKADSGQSGAYLIRSNDGGMTWPLVTPLALSNAPVFEEPAIVVHSDGRIISFLRTDNRGPGFIYQAESSDEGYTWSDPEQLELWGYPADLISLKNGGVLATYGYRQLPAGIRYCLSKNGRSWSIYHEQIIRADGHDEGELGYPASVELESGVVFTAYYFTAKEADGLPFIGGTYFRIANQ